MIFPTARASEAWLEVAGREVASAASRAATHPRISRSKSSEQSWIFIFRRERSDHRRRQSSTIVRITPYAVGMTDGHCGFGIWLANILWTPTATTTIAAPADTSRTRLFPIVYHCAQHARSHQRHDRCPIRRMSSEEVP